MSAQDLRLVTADDVPKLHDLIASEVEAYVGERLDVHRYLYELERATMIEFGIHLGEDMQSEAIRAILKTARRVKRDYEAHS